MSHNINSSVVDGSTTMTGSSDAATLGNDDTLTIYSAEVDNVVATSDTVAVAPNDEETSEMITAAARQGGSGSIGTGTNNNNNSNARPTTMHATPPMQPLPLPLPPPYLPNGDLIDCKNTLHSHSLLYCDVPDGLNSSANGLQTAACRDVPYSTDNGHRDFERNRLDSAPFSLRGGDSNDLGRATALLNRGEDDSYNAAATAVTTPTSAFCPVAVPVPDEGGTTADTAAPNVLHCLMMEPTRAEEDRLLGEAGENDQRNNSLSRPSRRSSFWKAKWFWYRVAGWLLTVAAVVLLVSPVTTRLGPTERRSSPDELQPISNHADDASGTLHQSGQRPNGGGNDKNDHDVAASMAERDDRIVQFINNITLSGKNMSLSKACLENDNGAVVDDNQEADVSVEELALQWIVQDDFLVLPAPTTRAEQFRLQQRYAVATFWKPWTRFGLGVSTSEHECDWWPGIACQWIDVGGDDADDTGGVGVLQRVVTEIQLSERSTGQRLLTADVGLLSNMVHFDVSQSSWLGSLPSSIGKWARLKSLNVSLNGFAGSVPDSIEDWTELESLDVSSNARLSMTLSGAIGGWSNLKHFNARWSALKGSLPDTLGQWTNLEVFDVAGNRLSGSLPAAMARWTKLIRFDVDGAMAGETITLTGSLPDFVGQWTSLEYFDMTGSGLTGSLPHSISRWTNLKFFKAIGSGLSGPLPRMIGHWSNLTSLNLMNNIFSGPLPDFMGELTKLEQLHIGSNTLSGSLPSFVGRWTNLQTIDISGNDWTGSLPDSIGQWSKLTMFNAGMVGGMAWNKPKALVGTLPASVGAWTNLTAFGLARTRMTGSLPDAIGKWTKLQIIDIFDNDFSGSLPPSISNWSELAMLTIGENGVVGTIPTDFCRSSSLYKFFTVNCKNIDCSCGPEMCHCRDFTLPE